MIVRPSVVFPQPDSPTTPSVSPARTLRSTPSTARTCPTVCLKSPALIGKCLTRPSMRRSSSPFDAACAATLVAQRPRSPFAHRASAAGSCDRRATRCELLGEVARREVIRRCVVRPAQRRDLGPAHRPALRVRHSAGGTRSRAAGVIRLGGWPGIGSSRSLSDVDACKAVHEPDRVRVAGRVEDREDVADLDDAPGVHDDHAVGELGDEPEVVRDEDDRGVRLAPGRP